MNILKKYPNYYRSNCRKNTHNTEINELHEYVTKQTISTSFILFLLKEIDS